MQDRVSLVGYIIPHALGCMGILTLRRLLMGGPTAMVWSEKP